MPAKEESVTIPISIMNDYLHSIGLMNELLSHFDMNEEDAVRYKYVSRLIIQSGNRIKEITEGK